MASRIVIVGAGGFGREVHAWLLTSPEYLRRESVGTIVFINDIEPVVPVDGEIVATIDAYAPLPDDLLLCALGSPAARRTITEKLEARGARFATFVHDSVVVGARVDIGRGAVICPGVILTTDISIGDHVHVNINTSIGHDVTIGAFSTVSPACNLMGKVAVGSGVFLGTAATVVPDRTVHDGAIIGAGSVVVKDIPAGVTAFGNPCVPRGT